MTHDQDLRAHALIQAHVAAMPWTPWARYRFLVSPEEAAILAPSLYPWRPPPDLEAHPSPPWDKATFVGRTVWSHPAASPTASPSVFLAFFTTPPPVPPPTSPPAACSPPAHQPGS